MANNSGLSAGKTAPAAKIRSASRLCMHPPSSTGTLAGAHFLESREIGHSARNPRSEKSLLHTTALPFQDLFPHVLQNVRRTLHTQLARQNRILILDRKNPLVVHVHIRLHHRLP